MYHCQMHRACTYIYLVVVNIFVHANAQDDLFMMLLQHHCRNILHANILYLHIFVIILQLAEHFVHEFRYNFTDGNNMTLFGVDVMNNCSFLASALKP